MYMCIHRHCDQHPKANPLVLLPDCKGWTPLHYACYDNNMKLVLQLRDAGADPNTRYLYTWRDTFCFSVIVTLIGTIHNGCCPYLPNAFGNKIYIYVYSLVQSTNWC